MFTQRMVVRLLIGSVIGAVPGCIVLACGNVSQGCGLIMGGIGIGGLLAIPDVSPRRVFRLFITVMVAKNIPFVQEGLVTWVDAKKEVAHETPFSDAFTAWLLARDTSTSRGWFVACGLVVGVMFGAGVVLRDVNEVIAGRPAVTLPQWGEKDTLETKVLISIAIAIGIAIWITAGCGLLAAPAFRRPILIGGGGSLYFGTCFGLLAGFPVMNPVNPMTLMLTTMCVGIALLVGAGWEPLKSADSDSENVTKFDWTQE